MILIIILPVNILITLIERSLKAIAKYVPLGLMVKLKGIELTDNSLRYSVYILHEYLNFVGKSKV